MNKKPSSVELITDSIKQLAKEFKLDTKNIQFIPFMAEDFKNGNINGIIKNIKANKLMVLLFPENIHNFKNYYPHYNILFLDNSVYFLQVPFGFEELKQIFNNGQKILNNKRMILSKALDSRVYQGMYRAYLLNNLPIHERHSFGNKIEAIQDSIKKNIDVSLSKTGKYNKCFSPNIWIIDDNTNDREYIKKRIEKIFEGFCHKDIKVKDFETMEFNKLKDSNEAILKCDLIFLDIIDEDEDKIPKGIFNVLAEIDEIKGLRKRPIVIMLSSSIGMNYISQSYKHGADWFINKGELELLSDDYLKESLSQILTEINSLGNWEIDYYSNRKRIKEFCKKPDHFKAALYKFVFSRNNKYPIEFDNSMKDRNLEYFEYIIWKLFKEYDDIEINPYILSGHGASCILIVTPIINRKGDKIRLHPSIVKISSINSLEKEYHNYNKYVANRIHNYASKINQVVLNTDDIGVLEVKTIGFSEKKEYKENNIPLKELIINGELNDINNTIESLYNKLLIKFHQEEEEEPPDLISYYVENVLPPLYEIKYDKVFEEAGNDRYKILKIENTFFTILDPCRRKKIKVNISNCKDNCNDGLLNHIFFDVDKSIYLNKESIDKNSHLRNTNIGVENTEDIAEKTKITKINEFIGDLVNYQELFGKPRFSIVHGDLHYDNVLLNLFDEKYIPWLIDFSNTGPGHSAIDFVVLEMWIKVFLIGDEINNNGMLDNKEDKDRVLKAIEVYEQDLSKLNLGEDINIDYFSNANIRKYYKIISNIRKNARKAGISKTEYYIGLLFYAARCFTFNEVKEKINIFRDIIEIIFDISLQYLKNGYKNMYILNHLIEKSKKSQRDAGDPCVAAMVVKKTYYDKLGIEKIEDSLFNDNIEKLEEDEHFINVRKRNKDNICYHAEQYLGQEISEHASKVDFQDYYFFSTLEPCTYRNMYKDDSHCCADIIFHNIKPAKLIIGLLDPNLQISGNIFNVHRENTEIEYVYSIGLFNNFFSLGENSEFLEDLMKSAGYEKEEKAKYLNDISKKLANLF